MPFIASFILLLGWGMEENKNLESKYIEENSNMLPTMKR